MVEDAYWAAGVIVGSWGHVGEVMVGATGVMVQRLGHSVDGGWQSVVSHFPHPPFCVPYL